MKTVENQLKQIEKWENFGQWKLTNGSIEKFVPVAQMENLYFMIEIIKEGDLFEVPGNIGHGVNIGKRNLKEDV